MLCATHIHGLSDALNATLHSTCRIPANTQAVATFLAKADGVLAGLAVADLVFDMVDPSLEVGRRRYPEMRFQWSAYVITSDRHLVMLASSVAWLALVLVFYQQSCSAKSTMGKGKCTFQA